MLNICQMETFRNSPSWDNYRTILAEDFGLLLTREPVESWQTVRGHQVRVDEWTQDGPRQGSVILVHGGGGNGRILAPFGEPVAAMGWRVLAPDLPGYGLTRPAPGYRGEYAEWPALVADLARAQSGPVVLMGLSMGGLTAFLAAQMCRQVSGVVATNLLDLSDREVFLKAARSPWMGRISLVTIRRMPWLFDRAALPLALVTRLRAMSSSRRLQRYFEADPLIGASRKPARFFRTAHQHQITHWSLHCPLLLVHPGKDEWTPTDLSRRVFERIEAPKRLRELSNGSHLPAEQPARDELMGELQQFLEAVRGRSHLGERPER
jgi:alpha-beta hydrolase superfamily lysophospholipase